MSNKGALSNQNYQSISVKFYKNIFFVTHYVTITFKEKNINLTIDYRPLINSTIMLLLFIALFSKISVTLFISLEIIIPIIFIALNIAMLMNICRKAVQYACTDIDTQIISNEQNKWIADPLKCSGCGELLNKYDYKCPECGLYCKPKANHSRFSSTNSEYSFNYIIK